MILLESIADAVRSFRITRHSTPLCRFEHAASVCVFYLVGIYALQLVMTNRKPFELNKLVIVHNMFLTVMSAGLLTCFAIVIIEKSFTYTPWEMICSASFHADGRLHVLYFVVSNFRPLLSVPRVHIESMPYLDAVFERSERDQKAEMHLMGRITWLNGTNCWILCSSS